MIAVGCLALAGCETPTATPSLDRAAQGDEHRRRFGDFELPNKVGYVPNAGLPAPPAFSPDGEWILYARTDRSAVSPMTLWGSPDPQHTPADGSLSIWLRPTRGTEPGRRLSAER